MAKMILPARDQASVSQSINVNSIQELLLGSSLVLDEDFKPCVDACNNILHIYLKSTSAFGRCPCCGEISSAVNSISFRHPQWMPVNGMTTYAHITLKRYTVKIHTVNEYIINITLIRQNSKPFHIFFYTFYLSFAILISKSVKEGLEHYE